VELIVRSGTMRDLLAQLEAHALDLVLSNTAPRLDARMPLRNHLLREQAVSLVGKPRRAPDLRELRAPALYPLIPRRPIFLLQSPCRMR
jgi:LysR family transcriptional activator of nhaA